MSQVSEKSCTKLLNRRHCAGMRYVSGNIMLLVKTAEVAVTEPRGCCDRATVGLEKKVVLEMFSRMLRQTF